MRTILLLVHDDPGQEARIAAATALARAIEGHVHCLDLLPLVAAPTWPDDAPSVMLVLNHELTREIANARAVQRRLDELGIGWTWTGATGDLLGCIADASAETDLVVVNAGADGYPYPGACRDVAKLIARSPRPVFAVPAAVRNVTVAGHALIAWNGSISSMHAIAAALPVLRAATHVTIFEIDDATIDAPAEEAARFLAPHDIAATVVRERAADEPVARVLMRAAHARAADYIVMGGFGHARAIESIFGGVTHSLLAKSTVPLLLAH